MTLLQPLLFSILSAISIWIFSKNVRAIRRNIQLGKDDLVNDNPSQRWKNLFLLALGQKKMFRNPLVALLHLLVYVGFVVINIEILEIVIDGISGRHRVFAPLLKEVYPVLINAFEVLAFSVLVACIIFLVRRGWAGIGRFTSADINGWPRKDALIILATEIFLMSLFLLMNASDTLLQQRGTGHFGEHPTGNFLLSSQLHGWMSEWTTPTLLLTERLCWWMHIAGIFAFLNYLPYSKHLHIVLAFPNAYYARLQPHGVINNMPSVQQEVLYAMQPEMVPSGEAIPPGRFGARDVMDLSRKNLMDAYSCTECGRCTAACPANLTGKKLSPRKIMMDTRDRLEEVGKQMTKNGQWQNDNRSLLHDYISREELNACTTCNACVQECPVSISPLDIIIQLRRNLIMEESETPVEWATVFNNIENNFAPWKFSPDDRDQWATSG